MMKTLQKSFLAAFLLMSFGSSYAMTPEEIAQRRELAARAAELRQRRAQNPNMVITQESGTQTASVAVQDIGAQTESGAQEEEQCSICLEGTQQDNPLKQTLCGHFFHVQCLDQARQNNNSCPTCRTKPVLFAGTEGQKYLEWVAQRIPANQQPSLDQLMRRTPSPQAVAQQQAAAPQPAAQQVQGRSVRDLIRNREIPQMAHRIGGISILDLSRRGLTSLEGLADVPGINSVTTLYLSSNQLTEISANAFRGLDRLRELGLLNNPIRDVADNAFSDLINLRDVSFDLSTLTPESQQRVINQLNSLRERHNNLQWHYYP